MGRMYALVGPCIPSVCKLATIEAIKPEKKEPNGSPISYDILMIDITGDIAVVKVTDGCFGTKWTDYLTLIKHDGNWQIVMKAFYDHANDRGA